MTEEVHTIQIKRYRDKKGNPTCSEYLSPGKSCRFLGVRNYGTQNICLIGGQSGEPYDLYYQRDDEDRPISIKPINNCLAWS